MKRFAIVFFCIFILGTKLFGNEIKIYAPVAQNFLIDKNNYIRYSPINIFDNSSETVFAVTFNEIDKRNPALVIYFGEHAEFDCLSIKPGYFDERYFEKNNRIKKMNIKIFNCRNIEYNETIEFQDKMSEQKVNIGKKLIATKIEFYIQDIFPGSKWNDLVISDINFLLNGTIKKVLFDTGDCAYCSTFHRYEYDNQNRIIHEYTQYGKSGADDKYYKYENDKIYKAYVGMDDDPNNLKFELIDSIKEPTSIDEELFYKDGKIIAGKYKYFNRFSIKQYIYNDNQLVSRITICENSDGMDKFTKYVYNENGLLIKTESYDDGTLFRSRYE